MNFTATHLVNELARVAPANKGRYVIAFSGGMDSHVLLYAMTEVRKYLDADIVALHVNHGISIAADHWVEHCRQVCQQMKVQLEVVSVRVDQSLPSLENELRTARYAVFEENLHAEDVLLLAHHADDQAETLLQRLFRGSGHKGAAGMPRMRAIGKARLLRPLLDVPRSELREYAERAGLQWIEDDSNTDEVFDRNYIRHTLLPIVANRWPGYRSTLMRNAEVNGQADQCLAFFMKREIERLNWSGRELDVEQLQHYESPIQLNLLRSWIASFGFPTPSYEQLCQILSSVVNSRVDAQPVVEWAGIMVRRYRGKLYAGRRLFAHNAERIIQWRLPAKIQDPAFGQLSVMSSLSGGIRMSEVIEPVTVRFRRGGERCRPKGRQGSHPLKKLLQEYGVPPWLRERVPLVYIGENLAAVADLWVCHEYSEHEEVESYRFEWNRP